MVGKSGEEHHIDHDVVVVTVTDPDHIFDHFLDLIEHTEPIIIFNFASTNRINIGELITLVKLQPGLISKVGFCNLNEAMDDRRIKAAKLNGLLNVYETETEAKLDLTKQLHPVHA